MTTLTLTHLRFDCTARERIHLGGFSAGERLRNALTAVMLRAGCAEGGLQPSAAHAAACPVCWLLASQADPGEVRRAYSLVPPVPAPQILEPGQDFSFTLTLYGEGIRYLPYFVLAVPVMGDVGVGPGRGPFALRAISALDPLTGRQQIVLLPGEQVVRIPNLLVRFPPPEPAPQGNRLIIDFLTPLRLIYRLGERETLLKIPTFDIFFQRMLERIDELGRQYAGAERRPADQIEALNAAARSVRLVEQHTQWIDLFTYSGRKGTSTPMGGLVGSAEYYSEQWLLLLPYLRFGQAVQVGKLTVKGNGVFSIRTAPPYWEWLYTEVPHDEHYPTPGA